MALPLFCKEVLDNHKSVLNSFGIQTNDEELDLPYIYWIQKKHKIPINADSLRVHRSVRPRLYLIYSRNLLRHIKQCLQKYCEIAYSRSGLNQMWILKNSKDLLENLKSPNFNLFTSIKSFDFLDPLHHNFSPKT